MVTVKNENTNTKEMKILLPTTKIQEAVKCKNTKQAYKIFRDLLDYEEYELKNQEHFWIMGVDSVGYVVCVYIAAIGSENRMIIDPIDIFSMAISCKARKVFLAHNHPDDNKDTELKLSKQDFNFTNKLYHACLSFGITIIDHIILADDIYYSLGENKYMAMIHKDKTYKTYKVLQPKLDDEKAEAVQIAKREEKIEMIKTMLEKKYTLEQIVEVSKFTIKEVRKIKKDMQVDLVKNMLKLSPDEIDEIVKISSLSKEEVLKIKSDMGLEL